MVSKGEVSAVELVESCMSRIEEVNPKLNAVVQFCTTERWRRRRRRTSPGPRATP